MSFLYKIGLIIPTACILYATYYYDRVLGLDFAGKTTLCKKLTTDKVSYHAPTEKVSVYKYDEFFLYDQPGLVRVNWLVDLDAFDGILFVVDGTNKSRLGEARAELLKVLKQNKDRRPIAILFNKIDNAGFISTHDLINGLGIESQPNDYFSVFECSGAKRIQVVEPLHWILTCHKLMKNNM